MIERQPSQEAVGHYQDIARDLMERYSWQLLSPELLVAQSFDSIEATTDSAISKALVGRYCIVLYHVFLGEQGRDRQERACYELEHMLRSFLIRDYPRLLFDERRDVIQNTLERIWRARHTCREPAAFLAFATFHLLTAVQYSQRQLQRFGEPLKVNSNDEHESYDIPDDSISLMQHVLDQEYQAAVRKFIHSLRQQRPRASNQIDVLELRSVEDLDYTEISQRLNISRETAYQRLSRILKTINTTPALAEQARELGLSSS